MFTHLRNNPILRIGTILTAAMLLFFITTVFAAAPQWQDEYTFAAVLWAAIPILLSLAAIFLPTSAAHGTTNPSTQSKKGQGIAFPVFIFLAAFTLKLLVALWAETQPVSDFLTMHTAAADLSRGGFDHAQPYWPYLLRWAYQTFFVMYEAAILAICPESFGLTPLLVANALFMAGVNVFLYLLVRSCALTEKQTAERAARVAALLYLFYPAPYFLASVLTNQHVSLFFVLLGLWLLLNGKQNQSKRKMISFILSGICMAVGNALRPDASLLFYAILGAAALHLPSRIWEQFAQRNKESRRWKALWTEARPIILSVCAYAATGLLLSAAVSISGLNPNGLRNMNPEWKFVIGLNADTGGIFSRPVYDRVFPTAPDDPNEFIFDLETSREVSRIIIREHLQTPKRDMANFLCEKTIRAWGFTDSTSWAFPESQTFLVPQESPMPQTSSAPQSTTTSHEETIKNNDRITPFGTTVEETTGIARYAERIYFAAVCLLAAIGLFAMLGKKSLPTLAVICGLTLLLFFGTHIFIEVQTRYRYFAMPVLFILAGYACHALPRNFLQKGLYKP